MSYSARRALATIIEFKNTFPEKMELVINDDSISNNDMKILRVADDYNSKLATKDVSMYLIAETKKIKSELYGVVTNGIYHPYVYVDLSNLSEIDFNFYNSYEDTEYDLLFYNTILRDRNKDSWFFVFFMKDSEIVYVYANNPIDNVFERIDNYPKYREIKTKDFCIEAKDAYQICAIYALSKAPNVLITGKWGSGKSILTTAFAIANNKNKSFISRPPVGVDKLYDIGALPGDEMVKLEPWAMGFLSSVYYLFGNTKNQLKEGSLLDYVKEVLFYNYFELINVNSLQGLSLLDDYLIIDEVQYCTINLLSMILSRSTTNSKIILTGDLGQSYSIQPSNSGLLKLLRALPHKCLAYVDLKNSYRSDLIELADVLQDKTF